MNAVIEKAVEQQLTFAQLEPSVNQACQRIAPTWPLDQFIAVNPYWGFVEKPIAQAAKHLAQLSGTPLVMPRAFYQSEWQAGRLTQAHLQAAINAAESDCKIDDLIGSLGDESKGPQPQALLTQLVDSQRDLSHAMAWTDFVTH